MASLQPRNGCIMFVTSSTVIPYFIAIANSPIKLEASGETILAPIIFLLLSHINLTKP